MCMFMYINDCECVCESVRRGVCVFKSSYVCDMIEVFHPIGEFVSRGKLCAP